MLDSSLDSYSGAAFRSTVTHADDNRTNNNKNYILLRGQEQNNLLPTMKTQWNQDLKYGNNSIIIPIQCPDINDYDHFTGIRVAFFYRSPPREPTRPIHKPPIFMFESSHPYVTNGAKSQPSYVFFLLLWSVLPRSPAHSLDESGPEMFQRTSAILCRCCKYSNVYFCVKLPFS